MFEKTKITISAGIAPNARIAKIASNRNKPNGQFLVASDRTAIMSFMQDLPVRKLNGVGRVFERELDAIGIRSCGDIFVQRVYLAKLFGDKAFRFLMNCYLGLGRNRIQPAEEYERKSIGTESTFHDMGGKLELRNKLRDIAESLEKDLVRIQVQGRTLVLKIKLHTYEVFTRQVVPPKAVQKADDLYTYALPMLSKLGNEIPGMKLRLMGLRVTSLVSTKREGLDFFRVKRTLSDDQSGRGAKRKLKTVEDDGSVWEAWPEDSGEEGAASDYNSGLEALPDANETESIGDLEERNRRRKHGKEILPNPGVEKSVPEHELWDCPICSRPQPANDKQFNEHIDFCLSRNTIKEAVRNSSSPAMNVTDRLFMGFWAR